MRRWFLVMGAVLGIAVAARAADPTAALPEGNAAGPLFKKRDLVGTWATKVVAIYSTCQGVAVGLAADGSWNFGAAADGKFTLQMAGKDPKATPLTYTAAVPAPPATTLSFRFSSASGGGILQTEGFDDGIDLHWAGAPGSDKLEGIRVVAKAGYKVAPCAIIYDVKMNRTE